MKKIIALLIGIVLYSLFTGWILYDPKQEPSCTQEAMICKDGTSVLRVLPSCEFNSCPDVKMCNPNTDCPQGSQCVRFSTSYQAVCYYGDPCQYCPSTKCEILESYPLQVTCK